MKADDEKLREHLDWLGVTLLMTEPDDQITIPHWVVGEIVAALSSTAAGAGRPKCWTAEIESRAIVRLLDGRPVNAGARDRQGDRPERVQRPPPVAGLEEKQPIQNWSY